MEHDTGMNQLPLCTRGTVMVEHTVVWRWARSLWVRRALLASASATTDWDEPVSTMKSLYVPLPNRRRTLSEMSPGST